MRMDIYQKDEKENPKKINKKKGVFNVVVVKIIYLILHYIHTLRINIIK